MEESRAFTTYGEGLLNQLSNEVVVQCEGKTISVKGIWDTGATNTCISTQVVDELGLIATGETIIRTPSGTSAQKTYLIDVQLPNNVLIRDLVAIDSAIGSQDVGILIGMDVIRAGDFAVSNHNGKTAFTFRIPSKRRTDYVAEIRTNQLIGPRHGSGKRKKPK